MWPRTKLTSILKIPLPIIQAPMAGGATTPELVAAVSKAGGLGSLGAGYMPPHEIRNAIKEIKKLSDQPFAVSLFVPELHQATQKQIELAKKAMQISAAELNIQIDLPDPPYAPPFEEQMEVILEEQVPVFSFAFGIPPRNWLERFKKKGIILIGTATTLEEASLLEAQDIDIIAAQGSEAGGHRSTFLGKSEDGLIGLASLIPLLVDQVRVPVVAAGGIMDARGIVSALTLGAAGVQMGTAFLSCPESGIAQCYKNMLLTATHDNTVLTRVFSGKLARGIKNKFIMQMQSHLPAILDYPIQNALTVPMRKEAARLGNPDYMSLWAGQAVYLSKGLPASQLLQQLDTDVTQLLKKVCEKRE